MERIGSGTNSVVASSRSREYQPLRQLFQMALRNLRSPETMGRPCLSNCLICLHMSPISLMTFLSGLLFAGILLGDEIPQPASVPDTVLSAAVDLAPILTTEQVVNAIEQLRSPEFSVRQKSMEILNSVNSEQISLLAEAIQNHADNEVARRCVELLERRYAVGDRNSEIVSQASETLETASKSDRWFIAEAARDSLERHWKRRVEIALLELQKLGAPMSPKDPTKLWDRSNEYTGPFNRQDPTSENHLKIFVDEYWKTGPRGFELLQRLSSLVSRDFMSGTSHVSMYVIDGHPLEHEQIAELKAIFGDTRVSERGRVCLGISHQPLNNDQGGVEVSNIQRDSSAAKADIQQADVLLKFDGKPLKDFDQLISVLKAYRPDDEVTFEVMRYGGVRKPFDVKVKLQGWYER